MTASDRAHDLLATAARAADAKGGEDLVALDVSVPTPYADIFLIATGATERNVLAIADAIEEALAEQGVHAARREGRDHAHWILLDFGDLVVHVFHREDRLYYGLERLWLDCPPIALAPLLDAGSTPAG